MPTRSKPSARAPSQPKVDARLLGTWKSDKRRTIRDWTWSKWTSRKKRKMVESLFGKVRLTFTRTRAFSDIPDQGWRSSRRYVVLGVDDESVAIMEFGEPRIENEHKYWAERVAIVKDYDSKPAITHIHFDENHFWFSFGNGKHREFFRKTRRATSVT